MVQHIRRTQFIITYGPGAILEGQKGPRIIPVPEIGLFSDRRNIRPDDFEITDERMSNLLGGKRVFRTPSNAELNISDNRPLYKTKVFPEWWICSEHSQLFIKKNGCSACEKRNKRGSWDAIRFVMACRNGHLDDVNWDYVVHINGQRSCSPRYYQWASKGSSLKDIWIKCPNCNTRKNLWDLYRKENWKCWGRFPEKEPLHSPPIRQECDANAVMILRQATNLRMPEIITLFTIPPRYTRLHLLLEMPAVKTMLVLFSDRSEFLKERAEFEGQLNKLVKNNAVKKEIADSILRHEWDEIQKAIQDILTTSSSSSYGNILLEEFHALVEASYKGAPPYPSSSSASTIIFEVPKSGIREVMGPNGRLFRISPITRLRTVIVQKGYRRLDVNGRVVEVSYRDRDFGETWYPGAELLGEGIFLMLGKGDGYHPHIESDIWATWKECQNNSSNGGYSESLFREQNGRDELHPVFVWWHSLAHLLLRVLAVDSGYSSASIRERVYLEKKEKRIRGGLVLYTVQPGEGTMGGLISLVERFERFLERAIEIAESCPNDPLCRERKFTCGNVTGSACYGCLFVSETSCEHRNMWLDRNVLLEDAP